MTKEPKEILILSHESSLVLAFLNEYLQRHYEFLFDSMSSQLQKILETTPQPKKLAKELRRWRIEVKPQIHIYENIHTK